MTLSFSDARVCGQVERVEKIANSLLLTLGVTARDGKRYSCAVTLEGKSSEIQVFPYQTLMISGEFREGKIFVSNLFGEVTLLNISSQTLVRSNELNIRTDVLPITQSDKQEPVSLEREYTPLTNRENNHVEPSVVQNEMADSVDEDENESVLASKEEDEDDDSDNDIGLVVGSFSHSAPIVPQKTVLAKSIVQPPAFKQAPPNLSPAPLPAPLPLKSAPAGFAQAKPPNRFVPPSAQIAVENVAADEDDPYEDDVPSPLYAQRIPVSNVASTKVQTKPMPAKKDDKTLSKSDKDEEIPW